MKQANMNPAHFKFLDELRESGDTNMFGAAQYLAPEFALDKKEARRILTAWMKTFDGKSSAEERCQRAQEAIEA